MNIAMLLRRSASDHAERIATGLDDVTLTYREFAETGARFATHLLGEGLQPGERVGFFLPNTLDYLPGLLGVWQAGGVGVPLNYLFPDAPLRHAILDSGATAVVALPGDVARLQNLLGDAPVRLLTTGPDGSFTAAVAASEPATDVVPRYDDDDALIMYTSGSTGVPKGVRQTQRNVTAQVEAVIDWYELTGDDHALNCMPLFHVGGLHLVSLPTLLRGGRITFMGKWDPLVWLDLATTLRPTYGGLISTMLIDVGNRTVGSPVVLDSFRICMFGGSRTPNTPIERLAEGTGIHGVEIYGQTEQNGLAISYRPGEQRRTGSMGRPLSQVVQTRLVPPAGGPDIEPGSGEVGELWVRGDAVTPGYWNRPDLEPGASSEKWSDDGWFRTGDLMSADADGYLYYVDRIDDMIISGGENVFPQMVEEHLAACPDIAEVAVIGTAHERWVEQVTAIVVPAKEGVTAESIAEWASTHPDLRGIHRPRRIEIVDALPRTGSGKLNRPELRKEFP
ncbi:class I adenylate-forming enzyme family protein [Pseudonocardia sp. D17]|uniref:class I adenylate-forming enzyme family protein n=1 Tax=Pseudonocardia sp. D17 TaxID=882661 RepID=UPI002B3F5DAA|nr:AMP-dependent synthetase [Pseudonocardia sp. D17]